jgi:hypothetical protein
MLTDKHILVETQDEARQVLNYLTPRHFKFCSFYADVNDFLSQRSTYPHGIVAFNRTAAGVQFVIGHSTEHSCGSSDLSLDDRLSKFCADLGIPTPAGPTLIEQATANLVEAATTKFRRKEDSTALHEFYTESQSLCGLKVGDKVRVTCKAESMKLGWDNGWMDAMDGFVGQEFEINSFGTGSKGVVVGSAWRVPFFVLEKVEPKPEPIKIDPKSALASLRNCIDLCEKNGTLNELRRLMSAIRGPDSGHHKAKKFLTTPIRSAIFTESQATAFSYGTTFNSGEPRNEIRFPLLVSEKAGSDNGHYLAHVNEAKDALLKAGVKIESNLENIEV